MIDGDTLYVGGIRVRLHGIDSPEAEQTCRYDRLAVARASTSTAVDSEDRETLLWRCGLAATRGLRALLSGVDSLFCRVIDRDRWGRVVGRCFRAAAGDYRDSRDLGELLVSLGLALDYEYYSGGYYREFESTARSSELGVWRGCFTEPRAWRRGARTCGE